MADVTTSEPTNASTAANSTPQQNNNTATTEPVDYSKIESIVNKNVEKKENAILKSYFEQQGMTEDEVKTAISSYKAEQGKKAEEQKTAYANMQAENEKLKAQILQGKINSAATDVALDMGISKDSVKYVLKMADLTSAVDKDGNIAEDNLKNAIEQVLKDVPALKATQNSNGGFVVGADKDNNGGDDAVNKIRALYGLKPKK